MCKETLVPISTFDHQPRKRVQLRKRALFKTRKQLAHQVKLSEFDCFQKSDISNTRIQDSVISSFRSMMNAHYTQELTEK